MPPNPIMDSRNARVFPPLRCLCIIAASAAFAAILFAFAREKGVASDLYSLSGEKNGGLLATLANKTSSEIRCLCEDEVRASRCKAAFPFFRDSADSAGLLDFFRTHGSGLLTEKTRSLLESGDFARLRRSIMRRDYSGISLYPKAEDPCYFLSDYVTSLKSLMPKGLEGGKVLLTGVATGHEKELGALLALVEEDDGIFLSGAPFHALLATEKSKAEINFLGIASLAVIAILGFVLFRSFRFVLPVLGTLGFGFLAGSAALFAFFHRPHLLAFLFGSTLMGLGVDYCYHALAAPETVKRETRRNLSAALATTCLAFSPLLFSSVSILNQMAAFTISGLAAIWALAATYRGERLCRPDSDACVNRRLGMWMAFAGAISAVVAGAGAKNLEFSNSPETFYAPPPMLARGEKEICSLVGGASSFNIVSAPTLEEALVKEEEAGIPGLSKLLPSMKRQNQNATLAEAFMEAEGLAKPAGERAFLTLENLPPSLRALADTMILEYGGDVHIISPSTDLGSPVAAAKVFSPQAELETMFRAISRETVHLLLFSALAMLLVLVILYGKRVLVYASPLALAVLGTAGVLGLAKASFTFFHAVCFFLIAGIGIDYVIFHMPRQGEDPARPEEAVKDKVVLFSFLTSLVGFGALAFTSFPPTRAIGLTMAIGLAFAYSLSYIPRLWVAPAQTSRPWHEQKEKGATRLGILFIWHIYRLFGKTAAKIVFLVPLAFIAPFCRGVPFRKILAFAFSRIDIVDAVTLRKNTPRFIFTGDAGWKKGGAFILSSHLGAIEVLAALASPETPVMHAFQQMGHDPVFTGFIKEKASGFQLHAVEDIGIETASEMHDAIHRGELVLMAGDRPAAKAGRTKEGKWPRGVFRFAKLMESDVYAVVALKSGWNTYEVFSKRLGPDIQSEYIAFLESHIPGHEDEWYQF